MIAKYVRDLSGVSGDAKLFHLDEPLDGLSYIAVAVINWPRWQLVETQVFPATEHGGLIGDENASLGIVIKIPPVDGVALDHTASLATLGYEADFTPWPEPEPTTKRVRALLDFSIADPEGNVLTLTTGQVVELPIPVADNLIEQQQMELVGEE